MIDSYRELMNLLVKNFLEIATPLIQTHAPCLMYPIMLLSHTFNNESLLTMHGALLIVKFWSKIILTAFKLRWNTEDTHRKLLPVLSVQHSWILVPIQKEGLLPIWHFLSYLIPAQVWSLAGWEQSPTDLFIFCPVTSRPQTKVEFEILLLCLIYKRWLWGRCLLCWLWFIIYVIAPQSPQRFDIWWWSMMISIMTMMSSVWYVDHGM